MPTGENILKQSGKPLFFRLGNPDRVGLAPPELRLGECIRLAARDLSGMQKEALVVSARTGAAWRLASDEGAYLDGHDEGPCPLSFVSTGMVSATMNELLALAAERAIDIRNVRLIQDNYYTMRGSASEGTMTGGARDIELEAQIDAEAGTDALRALVADAVVASPLGGLTRQYKHSVFTLSHNGVEIETGRALPLGAPALPDPAGSFDLARIGEGDWAPVITRMGRMTPKTEETRTFAGGSLTDRQDRLLHLRVFCTLRPDGMKEIIQYMYNPHGSVFRFLSEEAPESGGKGRAPDALSLVAAGIGFCFMTQLGRYARIVHKNVKDHRIVQDAHFTLGGASGGTGRPGDADPVETHVYLTSAEDDEFARKALDMSEQTCFLHALCKAALKTRIRIAGFDAELAA